MRRLTSAAPNAFCSQIDEWEEAVKGALADWREGSRRAAAERRRVGAALEFEHVTPMLVMPFAQFKRQGRIMKSVAKWRDEALSKRWLVECEEGSGRIVIFISHT